MAIAFAIVFYFRPFQKERSKVISNKKFKDYDGFQSWLNTQDEDRFEFPLGQSSLRWVVCISGQVQFDLDDGVDLTTIILEKGEALFYKRLVWHKVKRLEPNSTLVVHSNKSYDRENDYPETKKEWKEALWKKVPDHPQIKSLKPRSKGGHTVYAFLHDTRITPTHWRYVVTRGECFIRQEFQKLKEEDLLLGGRNKKGSSWWLQK